MLTIKPEVLLKWKRKDGTYNLKIRITKDRKSVRLSTSIFVSERDLDSQNNIKKTSKVRIEVDKQLFDYRDKAIEYISEHQTCSVKDIAEYIRGKEMQKIEIDFISYCKEWIANAEMKRSDIYKSALNSFLRYYGKESLNINLMDCSMMQNYIKYLVQEKEEREEKLKASGKRPQYPWQ